MDRLSGRWIAASFGMFVAVELLLGGVLAKLIAGKFLGHVASLKLEAILILLSYFLGGLLIGLLSPRVRVYEPAIGAALAVAFTFIITFFTPLCFISFSMGRVLIGGGIAFALAMVGANLGEKLAAKMGNRDSKRYVGES